ncbi:diguanylate cyclase domain-containing protein [Brevibacillus sp. SYSU BS000544]|uniref:diguanylate cyclase n=1 Tax=Brevibacillus sp. SYSU BS000544 TaxID=3416443 RepID=UPI003CE4813B
MFRRIANFIQLDTLRNRLRFWNFLLMVVIIFVTMVPFSILEYQREEQNIQKRLSQSINIKKEFIEKWLDERSSDIRGLAKFFGTKQLIMEDLRSDLFSFQAQQREFYSLSFVNAAGIRAVDTNGSQWIDVSGEDYFHAAQNGKEFVSEVMIDKTMGRPVVLFTAPVLDEQLQFKGVIVGTVYIRSIEELITHFREGLSSETYLLNQDGTMLTESRYTKNLIDQGKVKFSTRLQYRVTSPVFDAALSDDQIKKSYFNYVDNEVYGSYAWVNQHKWLLISEITKQEVFTSFNQKLLMISVSAILVMLIGATIIYNLVETIRESLFSLQRAAEQIEKGNYQITFNPAHFRKAPREFRQLSDAFTKMVTTIQNKMYLLAQSEECYRHLVELSPEALLVVQNGEVVLTNDKGAKLFELNHPQQLIGSKLEDFIQSTSLISLDTNTVVTKEEMKQQELLQFQLHLPSGKKIDVEGKMTYLMYQGMPAYIVVFRDVTVQREWEKRLYYENQYLQHLSSIDSLMGIANRRVFDQKLPMLTEEALYRQQDLSLIMLDIDCFKEFNDTYGHQAGDNCLMQVAKALDEKVNRVNGLLTRYGGEELAILLPDHKVEQAILIAHELRRTVELLQIPHFASVVSEHVTVSLGVASLFMTKDQRHEQLVEHADQALYQAKQGGRNRVAHF